MKPWHSSQISSEERTLFFEEITSVNLRRVCLTLVIFFPVVFGFFIYNLITKQYPNLFISQLVDVPLEPVFLILALLALKLKAPTVWGSRLVVAYYIFCLVTMDLYYFNGRSYVGESPTYAIGVILPAVILLLPPAQFLTLLIGNHIVFLILMSRLNLDADAIIFASINGTTAVILAILAAWLLFTAKWNGFQKERLILKRNQQLVAANTALHDRNKEINEMMEIVAHDLRTPLYSLRSLYEVALRLDAWTQEPYRTLADESRRVCDRTLMMANRLLDTHAANHHVASKSEICPDIRKRAKEVLDGVALSAQVKEISLKLDFPVEPMPARVDMEAFDQTLENLLSNAIKFSPRGNTVEVALFSKDDTYCVEVRDQGAGIAENERSRMFQKFYRGKNSPTEGEPGAGLGLFIAQKLMLSMGGAIVFEPGKPRGSIFRMLWPVG